MKRLRGRSRIDFPIRSQNGGGVDSRAPHDGPARHGYLLVGSLCG